MLKVLLVVIISIVSHKSFCDAEADSFVQDVCTLQMDAGESCRNDEVEKNPKMMDRMYHFNSDLGRCIPFLYLGCGGNRNRFSGIDDCINSCQTPWFVVQNRRDELEQSKAGSKTDGNAQLKTICSRKPDPGPCKAMILMWTWDQEKGACQQFAYGGCGGNGGGFETKIKCEETCRKE